MKNTIDDIEILDKILELKGITLSLLDALRWAYDNDEDYCYIYSYPEIFKQKFKEILMLLGEY